MPQVSEGRMTFGKKSKKPSAGADNAYRKRAEDEKKRFKAATDADCYSCIAFLTKAELDGFLARFGLPRQRYIASTEFCKALDGLMGHHKMQFVRPLPKPEPLPDGFSPPVDAAGSLEDMFRGLAYGLLAQMEKASELPPPKEAAYSPHWVCAVFDSRAERDGFLQSVGAAKYGDMFVDGTKWLAAVG
jgi:hypothetical protein